MNKQVVLPTQCIDLEFRITPEDSEMLIGEAAAWRLSEYDRLSLLLGKLLGPLSHMYFAMFPVLAAAVAYFLDEPIHHFFGTPLSDSKTKVATVLLIAVIYWPLWWRYRRKLAECIETYVVQRSGLMYRGLVEWAVHWNLSHKVTRLAGVHRLRMDQDGLTLHEPNAGRPVCIPWRKISRVDDTPAFYKLSTRTMRRRGPRYFVPKHSNEMDVSTYQAGLRYFLEKCPVKPSSTI